MGFPYVRESIDRTTEAQDEAEVSPPAEKPVPITRVIETVRDGIVDPYSLPTNLSLRN